MNKDEVKIAVEWAAKEGWNPGLYDIDAFYATDPKGFFIGLLDNQPIACFSAVAYDDNFGFLGFYIVKFEYRAKGYGIQIWNAGLNHLKTQNIGLDGVVTQQENYKKSGFKLAYRNIRYQGIATDKKVSYPEIVQLSKLPFSELEFYDKELFLAPRSQFLKLWIIQPESLAIGYKKDNKLVGYSVIRKCQTGYKIGPLFADNPEIAEKLFQTMNGFVKAGEPIFLDTPEVNTEAVNLAKNHDMKYVFETARMYTKEPPILSLNKVFGVTTFELG